MLSYCRHLQCTFVCTFKAVFATVFNCFKEKQFSHEVFAFFCIPTVGLKQQKCLLISIVRFVLTHKYWAIILASKEVLNEHRVSDCLHT